MNWRPFMILLVGVCLIAYTHPDFAESRGGGGGRGGGGFSRGGGGSFSRGGGGDFGSIRNSDRVSTRDFSQRSGNYDADSQIRDLSRPTQGGLSENQSQALQDRASNLTSEQKQTLQDRAGSLSPEQRDALQSRVAQMTPEQRQQIKDRAANLTPEEKQQVREKFENSGLTPGQLPVEDPVRDRDEIREDWQDWRTQNREDWQNWYHDQYDDYWDDHWHDAWWYGYPVSAVSYSFYLDDSPPCQETVVVNRPSGITTYYHCNSVWYQPAYTSGDVKYIVISPPAGVEMFGLSNPYEVRVDGKDYFVSNHTFYQKIIQNGHPLYVSVDAPIGAQVPTIPPYAVEIRHQDQTYYQFDKVFYQRQGDFFVVVVNPGA